MKKNKSLSLKKSIKKIRNFPKNNFISSLKLAQYKFKEIFKSSSFILRISKEERYKKIIEKINQFKKNKSSSKNIQKSKISDFLILELLKKERYKRIIEKINHIKKLGLPSKKDKKSNNIPTEFQLKKLSDKLFQVFEGIEIFKFLESKLKLTRNKTNKKYDQKIGIAFYGDHNLIIASTIIDLNNNIKVISLNEMPIPGNVIGDSSVEDPNELANIILDSITLLDLLNSPLLIILSSSFFNIHTFETADLKQISPFDSQVQSKSPYLPADTLVDFLRMSAKQISSGLVRAIYTKKDFIKGWTDTLEIVNMPIIGVVPAAIHVFDSITSKITEEITILIDIEATQTTLLLGSNLAELKSHKLPFGFSLYITKNLKESRKNYFERVLNSVKLIINDTNQKLPSNIFVMGPGLDKLSNSEFIILPKGFQSISDLNLSNYSYQPKMMQIHETVSKSIDNSICSLVSILSSCV